MMEGSSELETGLDPERWRRIKKILDPALELPPSEVHAFLDAACEDPELRRQVETFLDAFRLDSQFLEEPALKCEIGAGAKEGDRIGPYRLLHKIGEGGMGEVFAAAQEAPIERTVALKLVLPHLSSQQAAVRFEAERQTLARMSHPNIAQVYDAGEGPGGRPFVVMELIHGKPITEHCDAVEMSIEKRLHLFAEVCDGVGHAHRRGVIHRDLKPSNVLVSTEMRSVPKIIDFGIAKVFGADAVDTLDGSRSGKASIMAELSNLALTIPGQRLGTPEHMSPEQAGGTAADVDVRSDVYALGVLLYELLGGRRPLELAEARKRGPDAVLEAIQHQEPALLSESLVSNPRIETCARWRGSSANALLRRLRGDLDHITRKALAKDPDARYESAAALAEDLRRHLRDEPILAAPPPGIFEQLARLARRHRAAALFAGLVLVSMTLGIVGTTRGLIRAQNAEQVAQAQAEKGEAESRRARNEAAAAERITDFLLGILGASDPTYNKSSEITLRQVLDNGARRARAELGDQPLVRARVLLAIGHSYLTLASFEEARAFFEEAAELRREHAGAGSLLYAQASRALADVLLKQGRYDHSREILEEALKIVGADPEANPLELARLLGDLGIVERRLDHLPQARSRLEGALELFERHLEPGDILSIVPTLDSLGLLLHQLGESELASEHLYRSLHLQEKALAPDHPSLAYVLSNLAVVKGSEGSFEEAHLLLERAIAIDRKAYGPEHPNVAIGLHDLGYLAKQQGDCSMALEHFHTARAILGKAWPNDHPRLAELDAKIERLQDDCRG